MINRTSLFSEGRCHAVILFLLALFLSLPAQAKQHRDSQQYARMLESPQRRERLQVDRVVQTLELQTTQKVADIGAGSGLFSRPLARKVGPGGTVFAIDIDPGLLQYIRRQDEREQIHNIQTILAAPDDPRIPQPVDLILICDTLHHIHNRAQYLKGLRRSLRPHGRIAIIDFKRDWPPGHESLRYGLDELKNWMKAGGYRLVHSYDFLKDDFFVVYQ